MVRIEIDGERAVLEVQGWSKLWAFRSRLEIPLANVRGVRADPDVARGWWKGFKAPGTHIPGIVVAGTFYQDGKRIFWDVRDPERTIVVELADDDYDELIVEVEDPAAEVARLTAARGAAGAG